MVATETEPRPNDAQTGVTSGRRGLIGRSPVWPLVLFSVAFGGFTVLNYYLSIPLVRATALVMPCVQLLAVVTLFVVVGMPISRRELCITLLSQAVLATVIYLTATDQFRSCEMLLQEFLYRFIILALWLLPIAGILLTCETMRRGQLRWRSWVPSVMRVCLAGTFVLIAVEATAFFLEQAYKPRPIVTELPAGPPQQTRIVTIGGSTMLGFPYEPDWGIGNVAVQQLSDRFPDRQFVLDNIARTGVNLEMAISYINKLTFLPDVLVVYSGHNEYFHDLEEVKEARKTSWGIVDELLAWSPSFRLIRPLIARRTGHGIWFPKSGYFRFESTPAHIEQSRVNRYRDHLRRLFEWAANNQVTTVFCMPASDAATYSPILSVYHSSDPKTHERMRTKLQHAWDLLNDDRFKESLQLCQQLLKQSPEIAEFHYLAGRCCRKLRRTEEAKAYFDSATQLDSAAIRMKSTYLTAGRDEANDQNVPIINCPALLEQLVDDGIIDDRLFLDGVHPKLEAHYVIGTAVAEAIASNAPFGKSAAIDSWEWTSLTDCLNSSSVTTQTLIRAYEKTGDVLQHYDEIRQGDDPERLRDAERFLSWSKRLKAGTIKPGEDGTEWGPLE